MKIARTTVGTFDVSTIRLPVDHSFGRGEPLWYETMIFDSAGGPFDQWQDRYTTEDEAMAGHAAVVEDLRAGKSPGGE